MGRRRCTPDAVFPAAAGVVKKFRASITLLRRYSKAAPCKELVPLLLSISIWLPADMPYSALKALVMTLYSLIPSPPRVELVTDAEETPHAFVILAPSNR